MRAALEPDHAAGAAASGEPAGAPGPARGASPRMRARTCVSPRGGLRRREGRGVVCGQRFGAKGRGDL